MKKLANKICKDLRIEPKVTLEDVIDNAIFFGGCIAMYMLIVMMG